MSKMRWTQHNNKSMCKDPVFQEMILFWIASLQLPTAAPQTVNVLIIPQCKDIIMNCRNPQSKSLISDWATDAKNLLWQRWLQEASNLCETTSEAIWVRRAANSWLANAVSFDLLFLLMPFSNPAERQKRLLHLLRLQRFFIPQFPSSLLQSTLYSSSPSPPAQIQPFPSKL